MLLLDRHCERSEAIQGGLHRAQPLLDCFVASLLAMTNEVPDIISALADGGVHS
jgi:hypothetical protein